MRREKSASLTVAGLLTLTACAGSTSTGAEAQESAEESEEIGGVEGLLADYEEQGGSCSDATTVSDFDQHGEALECSGGVVLFHWEDESDGVGEEAGFALEMFADHERYLVAEGTWAISVEGKESAEWVVDNLGGEIHGPAEHAEYAEEGEEDEEDEDADLNERGNVPMPENSPSGIMDTYLDEVAVEWEASDVSTNVHCNNWIGGREWCSPNVN